MKLRQTEYCHNCNEHVTFEFEDINERQVILCPVCGHEHYRELDDGTILNIRIDQTRGEGQFRQIRTAKFPKMKYFDMCDDVANSIPIYTETRDILGYTEDGRPIVSPKDGEEKTKVVTNRRWGMDPRQGK